MSNQNNLKKIELDAACAIFSRALTAYKRGELQRLNAEKAWARMAARKAK